MRGVGGVSFGPLTVLNISGPGDVEVEDPLHPSTPTAPLFPPTVSIPLSPHIFRAITLRIKQGP